MRNHKFIFTLIFFMIGNFYLNAQQRILTKCEITELYYTLYNSTKIDTILWNGNLEKCVCGSIDPSLYQKVEDRINFFRIISGLSKVKINPKYNLDAQNAAMLVYANNVLTHYPTKDMKCYSESASNGCLKSNLAFSDFTHHPEISFITGLIKEYGESNYYVGHRRWLLYTKLREFGYGATSKSEAVFTADGISYDDCISTPEFIAYPWNGYVPVNLIFSKWSFSIPQNQKVDFSKTTIAMYNVQGVELQTRKFQEYKNYLDHTIVWEAKGLFTDDEIKYGINKLEEKGYLNKKIKVVISNVVVDEKVKNYEYYIEPIKL